MAVLKWSDSLSLGLPFMDDMHRNFVELLARVQTADPVARDFPIPSAIPVDAPRRLAADALP